MKIQKVSDCCGAKAIEYANAGLGTYWCSQCTKSCILVNEEEQFWDASVARAKKENEKCVYCGENKWENPKKHIEEMIKFLQEKMAIIAGVEFGESLEILNKL